MRRLPNILTSVRMLLTPFVVFFILEGQCGRALLACLIAGVTDGLDGYLARRFRWISRTGAYLDPIADKLMLSSAYLALGLAGRISIELTCVVLGRDLWILAMVGAGLLFTPIRDFPPSVWGKISTLSQIVGALGILAACAGSATAEALQRVAIPCVWMVTVWSGVHYTWRAICSWNRYRRREAFRS